MFMSWLVAHQVCIHCPGHHTAEGDPQYLDIFFFTSSLTSWAPNKSTVVLWRQKGWLGSATPAGGQPWSALTLLHWFSCISNICPRPSVPILGLLSSRLSSSFGREFLQSPHDSHCGLLVPGVWRSKKSKARLAVLSSLKSWDLPPQSKRLVSESMNTASLLNVEPVKITSFWAARKRSPSASLHSPTGAPLALDLPPISTGCNASPSVLIRFHSSQYVSFHWLRLHPWQDGGLPSPSRKIRITSVLAGRTENAATI